jgi:hypothetical protein
MITLMMGAPVLIDTRFSRPFLEDAQHLGAEMARELVRIDKQPKTRTSSSARLDDAVARLRASSAPLIRILNLEELVAAEDGSGQQASSADQDGSGDQDSSADQGDSGGGDRSAGQRD